MPTSAVSPATEPGSNGNSLLKGFSTTFDFLVYFVNFFPMKKYHVYILSNQRRGTIYVGVTSNLFQRMQQHKSKAVEGFTKRYSLDQLVYAEYFTSIQDALKREKQLKNWHRHWKIELIEKNNPEWQDLCLSE